MKTKLICFIGTDGSGKSSASEMLAGNFKNEKRRFKCTWGAYDLWLLRPLVKCAKKMLMKQSSPDENYRKYRKDMAKASGKVVFLKVYRSLIFCEYFFEIFVKVKLPMIMGYDVICDRYVFDTMVNISSNSGLNMTEFHSTLKRWLMFFPKPDLVVYVATPPEVSLQRKDDIPHVDYLKQRIPYYEEIASRYSIIKVDGTESLGKINQRMEVLFNEIKRQR